MRQHCAAVSQEMVENVTVCDALRVSHCECCRLRALCCSCRQPGDRYRSWDPARKGRFEGRIAEMLLDPRCTQEVRRVWIGYLSQCDARLGQNIAQKLQAKGAL